MELPKRVYANDEVRRLHRDLLEFDLSEFGGGAGVSYGSPLGLTVGGSNQDGVSTDAARADHRHALPAFGSSAGTFAEGSDLATLRTVWDPRVVPSGLHAHSDEFDTDTIANWGDMDEGAYSTSSVVTTGHRRCLQFSGANAAGGTMLAARYKAIPSNTFVFLEYVSLVGPRGNGGFGGGLCVMADATAAGTDLFALELRQYILGTRLEARDSSGYTNGGAVSTYPNGDFTFEVGVWFAGAFSITLGVTSVVWSWSSNGLDFTTFGTSTQPWAAQHYGVCANNALTATDAIVRHRHFRVFDGATSVDSVANGGYLVA